jgi:hypothetical protein
MFGHKFFNPNSIPVFSNSRAIPFGHRCTSALACRFANVRTVALPFDWTFPSFPSRIKSALEGNFEHFVPHVENGVFINKYNIELTHFNPDTIEGIKSYLRRVDAFDAIMDDSGQSKSFVYINEDYLYDSSYRDEAFMDNLFNEMLELESYLKVRYPGMDYNILYFDFKVHDIPTDSRIINIVLSTPILYETADGSPYELLRHFCGGILAGVFETDLSVPGYDFATIFNN